MGAHSCELFCNLGLCCLYGGQLDLVLPCFQRAIRLATTPEQRADVWYNLSFVALVCIHCKIFNKEFLYRYIQHSYSNTTEEKKT